MANEIHNIVVALEALADTPLIALKLAVPKIAAEIARQFDEGKDAYGRPWASLAEATISKGRSPPPLTDTGAMKSTVKVETRGNDQLVASIADDPARFHQSGTKRMPARPILPTGEVPEAWAKAVEESVLEALKTLPIYAALRK